MPVPPAPGQNSLLSQSPESRRQNTSPSYSVRLPYNREPLQEYQPSFSTQTTPDTMPLREAALSGFEYIDFEDTAKEPETRGETGSKGAFPKSSEGVVMARDFTTITPPHFSGTLTHPDSACTAHTAATPYLSPSHSVHEKSPDTPLDQATRVKRLANRRTQYHRMESTPEINQSSRQTIRFADGDFIKPNNAFARSWVSLYDSNIIIRWFFFITPVLVLVWIPGMIGLTLDKSHLDIWGVELVWWSAWLSIAWGGWWIGLAIGILTPKVFKYTIGVILPPGFVDKWVGYLTPMKKVIMGAIWSFLSWLTFNVFILKHKLNNITEGDDHVLHWIIQGLFGMFLSSLILVAEKLLIQIIASNFHRRSYEDRIREQKQAIRALVTLYMNSHDIGRSDTLDRGYLAGGRGADPARVLRKALKGVRQVAKSTTTVFGTVASEIAGERILQPNSPASMVLSALSSANKTRQLARRIYYSFVPTHYRTMMVSSDIGKFFDNEDQSREAFEIFDKDENGDASLEDIELACLDLHRERLSLGHSMRDLDSAVGRLDSILMFIWYFISLLIIIALLDVSFQTMLASAGTLTLGLSWLIGGTAQEVLSSVVFLFIKHPYDIGDRVDVDDINYVVKEMYLLYTVFQQTDGRINQLPHSLLNTKRIVNIRRSGAISESFTWDVDFNTSFDMIETLREKMLAFLRTERREFIPSIDISVEDFEGQAKMTLQADIKYKSNWQNSGLKTQRRNKWVCALKQIMAELEMWGPDGSGNPDPPPSPTLIRLLEGPAPLLSTGKTESPSGRTPVRSVQFGESSLATDLWPDEPLDTSPPLLPHPQPAHVPIDMSRGPSQHGTDIEMQFQRRN